LGRGGREIVLVAGAKGGESVLMEQESGRKWSPGLKGKLAEKNGPGRNPRSGDVRSARREYKQGRKSTKK